MGTAKLNRLASLGLGSICISMVSSCKLILPPPLMTIFSVSNNKAVLVAMPFLMSNAVTRHLNLVSLVSGPPGTRLVSRSAARRSMYLLPTLPLLEAACIVPFRPAMIARTELPAPLTSTAASSLATSRSVISISLSNRPISTLATFSLAAMPDLPLRPSTETLPESPPPESLALPSVRSALPPLSFAPSPMSSNTRPLAISLATAIETSALTAAKPSKGSGSSLKTRFSPSLASASFFAGAALSWPP